MSMSMKEREKGMEDLEKRMRKLEERVKGEEGGGKEMEERG